MKLRKATQEYKDCQIQYNMRFSDTGMKTGFIKEIPTIEEHEKWYKKNYKNIQFITEKNYIIGFLIKDDIGYISIHLKPEYQKKGYGTEILKQINGKAIIKLDNKVSQKVFEKNGWIKKGYYYEKTNQR